MRLAGRVTARLSLIPDWYLAPCGVVCAATRTAGYLIAPTAAACPGLDAKLSRGRPPSRWQR